MLVPGLAAPPAQASYGQQVRNMTAVGGGVTATEMAQQILGGTTIAGAYFSGDQRQGGVFSGFGSTGIAVDGIGIGVGTILSTGIAGQVAGTRMNSAYDRPSYWGNTGSAVIGPNWYEATTYGFGGGGDTDLDGLIAYMSPYFHPTRDAATLEFQFMAPTGTVKIPYIFASERYRKDWRDTGWVYPDKNYASFYSAMGIWVNGKNCATVGPSNEPVTVNTVNHLRNTDYYRDNPVGQEYVTESRYPTGFNGLTTVLTCTAAVNRGEMNRIKITVADVDYASYDSGVFVGQGSFAPDAVSGTDSTLTLDKNTADAGTNITATATIKDTGGKTMSGVTVNFTKSNPAVVLNPASCTTGPAGQCQITVTSATPVTDQVWAATTSGGGTVQLSGSPAPVTFTPVVHPPSSISLSLDKTSTLVGTSITATTTVKDNAGVPLSGIKVMYSSKDPAVQVNPATCNTTAAGTCSVAVTSATAGTYTGVLMASVDVNGVLVNAQGSPASVTFTAPAPVYTATLTLDNASVAAGTSITATTTVKDQNGTPVKDASVYFSNKSPAVHMSATNCKTQANGQCNITVTSNAPATYPGEIYSTVWIGATYVPVTGSPATVTYTQAAPVVTTTLTMNTNVATINTFIWATATAKDANGNPAAGVTVYWDKKSPAVTLTQPTCVTDGTGKCEVDVTSGTAGSYPDEVSVWTMSGANKVPAVGSPASVTFTNAPVDPAKSRLTLDKDTAQLGTPITATATVNDINGAPVSGVTVYFTRKSSAVGVTPASCQTDPAGKCSVAVNAVTQGTYPGEVAAAVMLAGQPVPISGSPATVTFLSGPVGPLNFSVTPVADPFDTGTWVPADGHSAYTAVFSAKDNAGNPLKNLNLADIRFETGVNVVQMSPITNNNDGTYSITLTSTTPVTGVWLRLSYQNQTVGTPKLILFKAAP